MSGYPPIPRDPSGAPLPVVWDDGLQSWKVYEGLMPLETKLDGIENKLVALEQKLTDGSPRSYTIWHESGRKCPCYWNQDCNKHRGGGVCWVQSEGQ